MKGLTNIVFFSGKSVAVSSIKLLKNKATIAFIILIGLFFACKEKTETPVKKGSEQMKTKRLTVLSYNLLEGMKTDVSTNKQLFSAWVGIQNPDIFAIQEANGFTEASLKTLAASYGHGYSAIVKLTGYPVALTSKYPITDIERINTGMTHGFIIARILDFNIVVLHLNPHNYLTKRAEMKIILDKISANKITSNLLIMGDFNSYSPLYAANFADGIMLNSLKQAELNNPNQKYLDNGQIDFKVQQSVLDFGLKDVIYEMEQKDPANAKNINPYKHKIDYIYASKDLMPDIVSGKFIKDDFTNKHSDHYPILINLKY